uniref:Nematode cuticle collagen N-terminal domain-containing protein n=1 Tax=Acrobeloides nanus TaxID=290746 RepID=A0A914EGS4_9BILA
MICSRMVLNKPIAIFAVEEGLKPKRNLITYGVALSFILMTGTIFILIVYNYFLHVSYHELKNEYDGRMKAYMDETLACLIEKEIVLTNFTKFTISMRKVQAELQGHCENFKNFGVGIYNHYSLLCKCNILDNFSF